MTYPSCFYSQQSGEVSLNWTRAWTQIRIRREFDEPREEFRRERVNHRDFCDVIVRHEGDRGGSGGKHKSLWYKSKAPSDIYDRKVENKNNTLYERALMEIGIKMWPCNKFACIRCAVNNGNPRRMNECVARYEYTYTFTNINLVVAVSVFLFAKEQQLQQPKGARGIISYPNHMKT